MTLWTGKLERRRGLALALLAALSLVACATSPRTDLSWNVNDRLHPRTVRFEGRVKLPPVRHSAAAPVRHEERYAVVPTPRPDPTPGWYTRVAASQASQPAPRPVEIQSSQTTDASGRFRWPVAGRVISDFGVSGSGERNDGINIADARGEPVHASASGTVSYCGNELKGYGNLLLIRHDGGYITAYAHLDSILVGRDDHVVAGQVIAYVGSTGDVASPQLHFEIRQGVHPLDPRTLLPRALVVAAN